MENYKLPEHGDTPLCLSYFLRFNLPLSTSVLDIGTRFGSFVNALNDQGYTRALGIDIDEDALCIGRSAYPHLSKKLHLYDGKSLPYSSATFNVITLFDVLEHIPNVDTFLREVLRVLTPNGMLVFQTPNKYINIPWEIIQHKSLTKWREFHYSLQSLGSLRALLEQAGFEEICIEKFNVHSDFKDQHVRKKLGSVGSFAIRLVRQMPLPLYPNFWGHAIKPTDYDKQRE